MRKKEKKKIYEENDESCVRNKCEIYSGLPSSQDKKGKRIDDILTRCLKCVP